MKIVITLLALTISANIFAASLAYSSYNVANGLGNSSYNVSNGLGNSTYNVSYGLNNSTRNISYMKEASEALQNVEDYRLSGEMSPKLNQQITDLQKEMDVSNEEALDLIIERSEEILR